MSDLRFRRAPFDIAPRAQRYTAGAWRIFGAGLLFLLVCAGLLAHSLLKLRDVQATQMQARAQQQELESAQRLVQARLNDPANLEKTKAHLRLQQMIRMSWFGLFDALESAARNVRGGVSLLSLVPAQAQEESTQVRLTAVAVSAPVMLEYLRQLRKDPRILSAELNSQQPDDNVGPGVIRMQVTVLWNPSVSPETTSQPTAPSTKADRGLEAGLAIGRTPVARVQVGREIP